MAGRNSPKKLLEFFSRIGAQGQNSSGIDTPILTETDGALQNSLYGKDSAGNRDPLRTNSDQQLQVEVVGGAHTFASVDLDAATEAIIYTVPAATKATVTLISICNRGSSEVTVRLGITADSTVAPDLAVEDYILFDAPLAGNSTVFVEATQGIKLAADNTIRALSSSTDVTVFVSAEEID